MNAIPIGVAAILEILLLFGASFVLAMLPATFSEMLPEMVKNSKGVTGVDVDDKARRMQAFNVLNEVKSGLAKYKMKTGNYPEIGSWEAMVGSSSPLVKPLNRIRVDLPLIRVDLPLNDPWGNPYEGKSTKNSFELKCAGPRHSGKDLDPIIITQYRVIGAP